jgi:prepilin-type N-terminal cleavage/methylation domain-containing protein
MRSRTDRRPWELRGRDPSDERGFTLVEMMVVVLVIGIMVAIALPTFAFARSRAQDRAVQADLRTGLAAGLTYFAEAADWDGFDPRPRRLGPAPGGGVRVRGLLLPGAGAGLARDPAGERADVRLGRLRGRVHGRLVGTLKPLGRSADVLPR